MDKNLRWTNWKLQQVWKPICKLFCYVCFKLLYNRKTEGSSFENTCFWKHFRFKYLMTNDGWQVVSSWKTKFSIGDLETCMSWVVFLLLWTFWLFFLWFSKCLEAQLTNYNILMACLNLCFTVKVFLRSGVTEWLENCICTCTCNQRIGSQAWVWTPS